MIFLLHKNAQIIIKVLQGDIPLKIESTTCSGALWELAGKFPQETICWCEQEFVEELNLKAWKNIFHHDLIMASYAVKNRYLPNSIGYIDQLPFVNVNRKVLYGTWQMSSDVGGIKGRTLLKFKPLLDKIGDFGYLLNSVAKIGQQNGLFCYSAPALVKRKIEEKPNHSAGNKYLFQFVHQHYSTPWIVVLFFCLLFYEKRFPFFPFVRNSFHQKFFKKNVDLSGIPVKSAKEITETNSIDVIIPTMGRPEHLMQVVEDLSKQTLLPKNVIVVEQNPEPNSKTNLPELNSKSWPFEIIHHFIHQTGACNARNIALSEVNSEWVFFADDDNRINPNILKEAIDEIKRYGIQAVNTAYLQPEEKIVFKKVKQWGTFGAGNGFVQRDVVKGINFSPIFEHGYGEDTDFGMQLRNKGCDIVYNPNIEILHLKAPMGGFRRKKLLPWEKNELLPKPSPTVLAYAFRYYTPQQIRGFKISLFLKYYPKQSIKNPLKYINEMRKRWKISEEWATRLVKEGK